MFCSKPCRTNGRYYSRITDRRCSTGTQGAISELRASVDLLKSGLPVYRALSPSAPADLIILDGEDMVSVEVRTGFRYLSGKVSFPTKNKADIFAVCIHGEPTVHFLPITDKGRRFVDRNESLPVLDQSITYVKGS